MKDERLNYAFIKLTTDGGGRVLYVDVSRIYAIHGIADGQTHIYVGPAGDNVFGVKETPDDVFKKISEVFARLNAGGA